MWLKVYNLIGRNDHYYMIEGEPLLYDEKKTWWSKIKDHKRTPKNIDTSTSYNQTSNKKSILKEHQSLTPITDGVFNSTLHKKGEINGSSQMYINNNREGIIKYLKRSLR